MIVILEGPRGCGKTTIATKVASTLTEMGFDAEYIKIPVRGEDPTKDQFNCIVDWSRQLDKIFVVDRFHVTELVYRLYDKKVESERIKREMSLVSSALAELGSLVFLLWVPAPARDNRVEKRADGRGGDIPNEDADDLWQFAFESDYFTSKISNLETPGVAIRKIVMMVVHSFENQAEERKTREKFA